MQSQSQEFDSKRGYHKIVTHSGLSTEKPFGYEVVHVYIILDRDKMTNTITKTRKSYLTTLLIAFSVSVVD